jgi:hypothetical protein
MTLILLLLMAFALLIGYGLGRSAVPSLRKVEEHLEAISCSLSQVAKDLCADKGIERNRRLNNDAGGDLSVEDQAYTARSLNIEPVIRNLDERVGRRADTAEKNTV